MCSNSALRCASLLFLFTFNDLFSNFVTASDKGNAICSPEPPKPLTFITILDDTFLVNRTKSSVEVAPIGKTIGQVTGGIFESGIYKFDRFEFYWNTLKLNKNGNFLTSRIIFCNTKYESVDEALEYSDGIIDVLVPIAVNAPTDNPEFSAFEKVFKGNIANPGDQIELKSESTFIWFSHFGPSSIYKTFKATYHDAATNKTYPYSNIIEAPSDPSVNFISSKQYANTFGSLRDDRGKIVNNPLPKILPLTSSTSRCGITVTNIKHL